MTLKIILYIEAIWGINQFTYILVEHRSSFLVWHLTLHTDESPPQCSERRPGRSLTIGRPFWYDTWGFTQLRWSTWSLSIKCPFWYYTWRFTQNTQGKNKLGYIKIYSDISSKHIATFPTLFVGFHLYEFLCVMSEHFIWFYLNYNWSCQYLDLRQNNIASISLGCDSEDW